MFRCLARRTFSFPVFCQFVYLPGGNRSKRASILSMMARKFSLALWSSSNFRVLGCGNLSQLWTARIAELLTFSRDFIFSAVWPRLIRIAIMSLLENIICSLGVRKSDKNSSSELVEPAAVKNCINSSFIKFVSSGLSGYLDILVINTLRSIYR